MKQLLCPLFTPQKPKQWYLSLLLLTLLSLVTNGIFAQITTVKIKGIVTDEEGEPISVASIAIKGKTTGVHTDTKGIFTIALPFGKTVLECSAVGYTNTQKILDITSKTDTSSIVKITLKQNTERLEEVVVTGYSTTKKRSVTCASVTVSSDKVIEGKVPGVKITPTHKEVIKASDVRSERKTDSESVPVAEENKKSSGLLTAGELSDFKKWKLWSGYNENEFKSYSTEWGIFPTKRYCVQVQDKNFRPVIFESVYLINANTNDTLWTAITDNTGKAELWSSFNSTANQENVMVACNNIKIRATPFANGINFIKLEKVCTEINNAEIAFVVDATGSMQDEISYLKDELTDIIKNVAHKNSALNIFTASVFYRDKGDDYITKTQPFSKGIEETIAFIRNQSAAGGGDAPESVCEALDAAITQLQWSKTAGSKIIFLVLDAPPHNGEGSKLSGLIQLAASKGIRIVPVACSGVDKETEFLLRSVALGTNGTYIFLTDDSGIGNPHIKPTTDEFKVELLNSLLQRTIEQMCYTPECNIQEATKPVPIKSFKQLPEVKLYPNPTNGIATLESDLPLKEILITDFTGKILMKVDTRAKANKYKINLNAFPSATYLARYITEKGVEGVVKIILIR